MQHKCSLDARRVAATSIRTWRRARDETARSEELMTTLHVARTQPSVPALDPLFPNVVFGIDFGSASLAAARWATANVARRAHAILSHVVPPEHDGDTSPGTTFGELRPALLGGLSGFARTLNFATVRSVLRMGRPSRCLSAIAARTEASLVVLGRRGDANRTRVGEPNVIERLARRSSASVLVVPEGVSEPPRHVIAAVDQSSFAASVLRVARGVARLHECPLTVLHVLAPNAGAYDRLLLRGRPARSGERAGKAMGANSAPAPRALPRWFIELTRDEEALDGERIEVVAGDSAREIVGAAAHTRDALVVVGQRGADGAPLGSLGSVTRELLTRGPMAVMAVA
jgi:nucleotide-binding universal stress UspA family protein